MDIFSPRFQSDYGMFLGSKASPKSQYQPSVLDLFVGMGVVSKFRALHHHLHYHEIRLIVIELFQAISDKKGI